ncbi:hypothetical protein Moror_3370 [Moniliophthora roreri MCA 2997]|uniref:SH3 domain-containing protein n=2 Tax=Moniliophthora roreri TaxID=221103 RepID=V2WJ99_MONRO|nr:hypothetical protein Moror_3370 [Moniliophthora roreri MCA 2997]KAI3596610.1 hypothetical protein WG66_003369 [Moniliophthora roreri]
MHAFPQAHPEIRRTSMKRRSVGVRAPALIDLPVNLPSVPILDPAVKPILTPLVDGPSRATPTSAVTPPPSTTTPSNGNGGSSGGSGGETGGSGGGQRTSSVNGGNGTGAGPNNGGSGGSQTGSDNGGSGTRNGGTSTRNTAAPGPATSHPSSPIGSASWSANAASPTGSNLNSSGNNGVVSGSSPVLMNAAGSPATTAGLGSFLGGHTGISGDIGTNTTPAFGSLTSATGSSSSEHNTSGGNAGGADGGLVGGGPGDQTATSGATSARKLSTSAIAGITVACIIIFLALLVLCLRRRNISRRDRRRNQWSGVASSTYNFSNGRDSPSQMASGTASGRSSFATSYDISSPPLTAADHNIPDIPVPQMAEIRDAHGPGTFSQRTYESPISPISPPPTPILISIDDTNRHRESYSTIGSDSSDPYTLRQVVYVPQNSLLPSESLSPMFVRPFSPTESFAFPKPPSDKQSSDHWGSMTPKRQSSATITARSAYSGIGDENPFVDPAVQPQFAEAELIRRPFLPSRDDELAVVAGDKVSVLQVFDDGWVAVQKISEYMDAKGKGKAVEGGPGLIPVDCLRGAGQELPDFLRSKRVSMYGANQAGVVVS